MCTAEDTVVSITKRLLIERKAKSRETYKDIADAIDVQESWLKCFASKDIKNPSADRIEKLYNYLTGKKLAQIVAVA